MKKNLLRKVTLALGAMALSVTVFAQDFSGEQYAKYGADPADREANIVRYNSFTESYKAKDYEAAATLLKELLQRAPKASQNIYAMGSAIYKKKMATPGISQEQLTLYIDSLMILHDIRLENFADDAKRGTSYIMTEKFKDYLRYRNDDLEGVVAIANATIDAAGQQLDVEILPAYYNYLVSKYDEGDFSDDDLINTYDFLCQQIDPLPASDKKDDALKAVEQLFIQSGVASCENIEKIYKPKLDAAPDDVELIKKISGHLARNKCKSEFQNVVAEKSYAIEPNAAAAVMLAMAFEEKGEMDKAAEYMNEAISLETDLKVKADYNVRAAGTALQHGSARDAAAYAKAAIECDPESGTAYMLLAQSYAVGASSACSGFNRSAAYWLVVDTLVKARELSAGDEAQLESIATLIRTYSGYFPKTEDMFFSDPPVENGSGYTVSCGWISGRTVARGR